MKAYCGIELTDSTEIVGEGVEVGGKGVEGPGGDDMGYGLLVVMEDLGLAGIEPIEHRFTLCDVVH